MATINQYKLSINKFDVVVCGERIITFEEFQPVPDFSSGQWFC